MVIASVELPRVLLDTTVLLDASVSVPPTGRVLSVAPGQDAQGAVNQAQPGDVVELQAGGVYPGLILPHRPGWTYLRSSGPLPPAGSRVTSHDMLGLATLDGGGGAALRGGSFWRVMGLELRSTTPWAIVDFHTGDAVDHVTLDRCWIHGTPTGDVTQGVRLDGTWIAVVDCSITDIHHRTNDAQALGTYDGWGPFKIVNCYLEASGENIMFGGWDPSIPGLIPSDIEIRGNYIRKPLSWQGAGWVVKNLLEFKNARRVLVEGNILENSWEAQQQGWAVLLTPRNQNGASPWSTVEDVTFRRNWVRQVVGGFQVMGLDNIRQPSGRTSRVLVTHNLFTGIGAFPGVMAGKWMWLQNGPAQVTIDHNTIRHTGPMFAVSEAVPSGIVVTNNVARAGVEGTMPADTMWGGNVFVGGTPFGTNLPAATYDAVLDASNHVIPPFTGMALDATDPGADIDALTAALVVSGAPLPPPPSAAPAGPRYTVQVLDATGKVVGTIPLV